jgi:hypothetical protein
MEGANYHIAVDGILKAIGSIRVKYDGKMMVYENTVRSSVKDGEGGENVRITVDLYGFVN